MKKLITLLVALLISIASFAQQGINYKAVIKDSNGNVVVEHPMKVRFIIQEPDGSSVYTEVHTITSDINGLIILNIGEGIPGQFNDFNAIDWEAENYKLQVGVDLEIDGSYVSFDASDFKAVPYAIYAQQAKNVTGLEKITQNNGSVDRTGWRLIGVNSSNYGTIGENAVDLSYQNFNNARGATGRGSFAVGYFSTASGISSTAIGENATVLGDDSTAMGWNAQALGDDSIAIGRTAIASGESSKAIGNYTTASGNYSTAMGYSITAPSFLETVLGIYNSDYTPVSTTTWNSNDRLFVIGSGEYNNRNNALTILKNGKTGVNTSTPASLFEVSHDNTTPNSSDVTHSFSIKNNSNGRSWQFFTSGSGNLLLYNDGLFRGSWNATSGAYVQSSDRRVKKDITALENGTLQKVLQLNPVSYHMKDQTDTNLNLGLISQEVQELFPSITHYNKELDILSLSYTELIPILIKALQEQQEIIDNQNATIEKQNSKIYTFENSMLELTKRMNVLETVNNQ